MRGAIPPLPNTPPWRGDQLKKHSDFTFFCLSINFISNIFDIFNIERIIVSIFSDSMQCAVCNNVSVFATKILKSEPVRWGSY
jgi:hypothetical protein